MKTLSAALFLIFTNALLAQFPVGHYMDSQGMPIVGYFDPLEYRYANSFRSNILLDEFLEGYYFDSDGQKKSGYIRLKSNELQIKYSVTNEKVEKIKPLDAPIVVVGNDSFFVENNFSFFVGNKKVDFHDDPQYLRYLTTFDSLDFAEYSYEFYDYSNHYYLSRKMGSEYWEEISKTQELRKEHFSKFMNRISLFESAPYTEMDRLEHMKETQAINKVNSGLPFYYDNFWNELQDSTGAVYRAFVTKENDLWNFKYFLNGILFQEIRYKKLLPKSRQGISKWYFEDGTVRKEIMYDREDLIYQKEYFENGMLHYYFEPKKYFSIAVMDYVREPGYAKLKQVNDEYGNSLLDGKGNGTEKFHDPIARRTICRTIKSGRIIESYFVQDSVKVFQWCNGNLNIRNLLNEWQHFKANEKVCETSVSTDATGDSDKQLVDKFPR